MPRANRYILRVHVWHHAHRMSKRSMKTRCTSVFAGVTLEVERLAKIHGEPRIICYGLLDGRMVVAGYTPRGADRHIFSMRKANEREKARIAALFEV